MSNIIYSNSTYTSLIRLKVVKNAEYRPDFNDILKTFSTMSLLYSPKFKLLSHKPPSPPNLNSP